MGFDPSSPGTSSSDIESYVYSLHQGSASSLEFILSSHCSDISNTSARHSLDYAGREQTAGVMVGPYSVASQGERSSRYTYGYSVSAHLSSPNPMVESTSTSDIGTKSMYTSPNTGLVIPCNRASFDDTNANASPVFSRYSQWNTGDGLSNLETSKNGDVNLKVMETLSTGSCATGGPNLCTNCPPFSRNYNGGLILEQ